MRTKITLACSECKQRNYNTMKCVEIMLFYKNNFLDNGR